ncbi:MAG TPA: hypothetical protein VKX17_26450 [Planctomycetota bacterium]|nr:hypothetical protein [Planctomycetota bacterium]
MTRVSKGPPPIVEALREGFAAYKRFFGPVLVGTLCAMVCGFVPLIGGFIASAGFHNVALKAVRGEQPQVSDAFIGFSKLADCIVIGLLQICGMLACFLGLLITQPLFIPGSFFIIDRNVGWSEAKDLCMEHVKPYLFQWVLFHFVMGIVATILVFCSLCVFAFLTIPIFHLAIAYAYNYSFGQPAAEAESAPVSVEQPA